VYFKLLCFLWAHSTYFNFPQYSFIANDLTFAVSLALLERTGCNRFKVTQAFVFTKLSTAFVDKHFQFRSG